MKLLEKDEKYIISLLEQGKKVEAIAFVKDKTGMTLKEAKDYIEKLILKKNIHSLDKRMQEIEEIVKTKETSISLSNQIQITQQKEEQQVQHFRRKR